MIGVSMNTLDQVCQLNWLEDRGEWSRYSISAEESVWIHQPCQLVGDPDQDDGRCEFCDEGIEDE